MSTTGMSEAFGTANRDLRAKRRALSNEVTAFLQLANSSTPPSISEFQEKQSHFVKCWEEVVTLTQECIRLIGDGEDLEGEEKAMLQETLDGLRSKMDNFKILESDYARKAFRSEDVKNGNINVSEDVSTDKTEPSVVEVNGLSDVSTSEADKSIDDSVVEKKENLNVKSELESPKPGESDSELNSEMKESDVSLVNQIKNQISGLLDIQTQSFNGNMAALHESNESLNRCVNKLSDNMNNMNESVIEIQSNVFDLKKENVNIKRDLEVGARESEKK